MQSVIFVFVFLQDNGVDKNNLALEQTYNITDEMRQEWDYNADRAWYQIFLNC